MRVWSVWFAILFLLAGAARATEVSKMTQHAHGTFEVTMGSPVAGPADGLSRYTMDKQIHGDLAGVSHGEMLAGGDPSKGEAGYVAVERVTGTLQGRQGSFALQHSATMSKGGQAMSIVVVPGSGTGQLTGIEGSFKIIIAAGRHSYDFDYTLP